MEDYSFEAFARRLRVSELVVEGGHVKVRENGVVRELTRDEIPVMWMKEVATTIGVEYLVLVDDKFKALEHDGTIRDITREEAGVLFIANQKRRKQMDAES